MSDEIPETCIEQTMRTESRLVYERNRLLEDVEKLIKENKTVCDICGQIARHVCFICGKDICEDHDFGGRNARIRIAAYVYNDNVFDIECDDKFMDCCPDCTDKLKDILGSEKQIMQKKLKQNLEEIKNYLLSEIKRECVAHA